MGSENAVLARGLFDGINNAADILRRDNESRRQKEREDMLFNQQQTQYAQGQQDRQHALQRRDITETRADAQYDRSETDRVRKQKSQQVLNDFMVRGNLDGVNQFLDEYSPEGMKPTVMMDKDGKYYSVGKDETGKEVKKEVARDDVGKLIMRMGTQDVFGEFQRDLDAKRAAAIKTGDRQFELQKIGAKGAQDRATEYVKAGLKRDTDGKVPAYAKELADLAKEYNGTTYQNGIWSFDDGKNAMAASHAALAEAIYLANPAGKRSTNSAHRAAARLIDQAAKQAEQITQKEVDEGKLDEKDVSARSAQVLESIVDHTISSLQQGKSTKNTDEKATEESGKTAPENSADEYYKFLKKKYPDRDDAAIKKRVKQKFPDFTDAKKKDETKDVALSRREAYKRRQENKKRKQQAVV